MTSEDLNLCFFGAAPDTGNLGVTALCHSTLTGLKRAAPRSVTTVFDNGHGSRWGAEWMGDHALSFVLCGGRPSRRLHQPSTMWNIRQCMRFGGLGNMAAKALLQADAILDVSGGDSFTDLYGVRRFRSNVYPKFLARDFGIPLILLPQTYGPFRSASRRRIARRIVCSARMAWARDEWSFHALQELLGDEFDAERHCCGVDLAFGLPPRPPAKALADTVKDWLRPDREELVVGLNVSGLIYNDPNGAIRRFGLNADYQTIVHSLIERLMVGTSARVLLVPHERDMPRHSHGDHSACRLVARMFKSKYPERICVLEETLDPSEIKHVIAKTDWFCGTRMHSTIAALSSGVPTATIAYSGKAQGVFETCGQGDQVSDPRSMDTEAVLEQVWRSWLERDRSGESLAEHLPGVFETVRRQMNLIVSACLGN